MKQIITYLLPIALVTSFTGCTTYDALQAAKGKTVQIFHDKMAGIEKAAISKDGKLCVFFVSDLTNAPQKTRFTLVVPLAEIQKNANILALNQLNARHHVITCATMNVPGEIIQENWTLLENTGNELTFIPVGKPVFLQSYKDSVEHSEDFTIPSGAKQAIYQTRISPIEFVYVDASMGRSFTVVLVEPAKVLKKRGGFYCLLPLTIPFDIATSPFQAVYYGCLYLVLSGEGHTP